MSKLQLLYEKFMRVFYIFGGVFFLLSLIDFSAAMMSGAWSCSSGTCGVDESYPFFYYTLIPFIIASVVFIVAGFVFFKLAHRESDLLSVSDYRKSIEQDASEEVISREDLYEKLRRGNRKEQVRKEPLATRLWKSITGKVTDIKGKYEETKQRRQEATAEIKAQQKEQKIVEEQRVEEEKKERARTKLNKTALILLLSKNTNLTQSNARLFLNSFLDTIKDNVIEGEEVKISKFGRFEKVHINAHTEVNPDSGEEITIEDHNTVEFFAYNAFLEMLNEGISLETEDADEDTTEVTTKEPIEEEVKTIEVEPFVEVEPVEENVQEIQTVTESEVEDEPIEETVEDSKEEPEEEQQQEPQQEQSKEELVSEVQEEPVVLKPVKSDEEKVDESKEKPTEEPVVVTPPVVEEKPVPKPKKPAPAVRTKKQIIELMDETTDLSKNKANKFLKYFAEVVKEQLIKREDVELEGIGFFTTIEMPAKEAVNPQTNEKIIVPAHYQVRLRFDDELKDKMNE